MIEHRWLPIYYDGFWDVPQAFLATSLIDDLYYFWRGYFDDDLDDYPSTYRVYLVKNTTIDEATAQNGIIYELVL